MSRTRGWGIAVVAVSMATVAACTGGSDTGTSTSSSSGSSGASTSSGTGSSGGSSGTGSSGGSSGASSGDATTCVTVDSASYSHACVVEGDCMLVATGKLCTGACACGSTPIAKSDSAKYKSDISSVKLEACPCASPGVVRCVQGACILCDPFGGDAAPSCPDGG